MSDKKKPTIDDLIQIRLKECLDGPPPMVEPDPIQWMDAEAQVLARNPKATVQEMMRERLRMLLDGKDPAECGVKTPSAYADLIERMSFIVASRRERIRFLAEKTENRETENYILRKA